MIARRWSLVVALVVLLAAPVFAQDSQCKRCGVWMKGGAAGFGMTGRALCELCKDPKRRCGGAADGLRDRIRQAEAQLQAWLQEEMGLLADPQSDGLYLQALEAAIQDLARDIQHMKQLLARLEEECSPQQVSDALQTLNPGTGPGTGSNQGRDDRTRAPDPPPAPDPQPALDFLDRMGPDGSGSDGSNVGLDASTGPTGSTGSQATASPATIPRDAAPEAAYLQGLRRYSAPRAPLVPRNLVRISEQGLPEPVLAEVPHKLPPLERAELYEANGVAYAEAFDRTGAEAVAAQQRGDRERALALLDHALLLAVEGQRAMRDARQERLDFLRALLKMAGLVKGNPTELFGAWLAGIQAQGLPPDRLQGLTPEQRQEVQTELLAIDPREAALTHHRLTRDKELLHSKPPDHEEWDLASVSLAHRIAGRPR